MKRILFYLLFLPVFVIAQTPPYSRVVFHATPEQFLQLAASGADVDHIHRLGKTGYEWDCAERDLNKLQSLGVSYEYKIYDLQAYYAQNLVNPGTLKTTWIAGTPEGFNLGSMGGYLTLAQLQLELDSMIMDYPSLISTKDTIGYSLQGRPIVALRISDNPNTDEAEPEVLYTALIHAREPMSLMQMIFFMQYLLSNYGTDPEATYLINNRELYFIPCINPDGYVYNETTNPGGGGMWRKNRRVIGGDVGVDLNRNFGFEWGYDNIGSSPNPSDETYRGSGPFSEPETQAVRDYCLAHEFRNCLFYHAYSDDYIYPWGFLVPLTPDSVYFQNMTSVLSEENHYGFGTGNQTVGYSTNGTSDDWMYGEQVLKDKIFSLTPEVGSPDDGFWPATTRIVPLCVKQMLANLRLAHMGGDFIYPQLTLNRTYSGTGVDLVMDLSNYGTMTSSPHTVTFVTSDPNVLSVNTSIALPALTSNTTQRDSINLTLAPSIAEGTWISGIIRVDYGTYEWDDTVRFQYGTPMIALTNDGSTTSGWSAGSWGSTTEKSVSSTTSLTDSPFGYYGMFSTNQLTSPNINLTSASGARLEYYATWHISNDADYAQLEVTTNGGSSWTALRADRMDAAADGTSQPSGEFLYDSSCPVWFHEIIDLNAYTGKTIKLRFTMRSPQWYEDDGIYLDDIKVIVFSPSTGIPSPILSDWNIFPNPSNDLLCVESGTSEGVFRILDLRGTVVYESSVQPTQTLIIQTISLPAGMYMADISVGTETKRTVLSIQH